MVEFMTAEEAARETVKKRLQSEIARVNEKIAKEMAAGNREAYVPFVLYKETTQLLENLGYYVRYLDCRGPTHISWKSQVDAIREDATRLAEVAKEAGITVVKPE